MSDVVAERNAWVQRVLGVRVDGRDEQVQGQREILRRLTGLAPPAGATEAEKKSIQDRIVASRSLLDDQVTNAELKQAKVELDAATALVGAANDRIAREAKERLDQAAAILKQARELAATIDADASEADKKTVTDAVKTIETLTSGAPSAENVKQAQDAIGQLDTTIKSAAEAAAQRREQRATRAKEILDSAADAATKIDADATQTERDGVKTAQDQLAETLKAPVTADALALAETALLKLNETLTGISERCETDRERRQQARTTIVAKIKGWLSVAKATESENKELATLAKPVTELATTPTDEQLEAAGTAATALETKAGELTLLVAGRQVRFEKAAELSTRLKPDAASLKRHDRAPEDTALTADIDTQRELATTYADWDQVGTWNDEALTTFETAIGALEKRVADLNKATEERITRVSEAEQRATAAITAASPRAFSPAQQTELLKAVKAETDKFASDIAQADSVAVALDAVAQEAAGLSASLAELAQRLGAVPAPDQAKLSGKEKTALKNAKDAAEKALDEVTEA